MLFSIIVPVYNIENYIEKCINSVLCQNFSDYELILIDDGSTDRSGEICDRYAGEYKCIHVIHQKNNGQAHARNEGIKASKGQYILFIDGDDYWHGRECLSKLAQFISKGGSSLDIIAFGGMSAYFYRGKEIYNRKNMNRLKVNRCNRGYTSRAFMKIHFKYNPIFYWYPVLYAYSRKLFVENNLWFPCNRKYEDVFLVWRLLLKAERIGVLPDTFYVYRRNREGSTTTSVSYKYADDFLWVIERNIYDVVQSGMDSELKSYLLNSFSKSYYTCCVMSTYLKKNEKKKMLAKLERRRRIMDYAYGKEYVFMRNLGAAVGFRNMMHILHMYDCLKKYKINLTIFFSK